MSEREITCCPRDDCRSGDIMRRTDRGGTNNRTLGPGRFYCHDCGATFDKPETKSAAPGPGAGHRGLAKKLADADPDTPIADGGTERLNDGYEWVTTSSATKNHIANLGDSPSMLVVGSDEYDAETDSRALCGKIMAFEPYGELTEGDEVCFSCMRTAFARDIVDSPRPFTAEQLASPGRPENLGLDEEPIADGAGAWRLTTDHADYRVWTHYRTGVRVEAVRFGGPAATLTGTEPDDAERWDVVVRPPEPMGEAALKALTDDDRYGEASAMERAREWMDDHHDGVPQTYTPETAGEYHEDGFEIRADGGEACPSCGDPIKSSNIAGPGEATVRPCGCRVDPIELPSVGAEPDAEVATDLTMFQHNILTVLAEEARYGLAVKRALEDLYGEEVNHGRLYPNLDDLVEMGLVEKSELDKRTNEYALTDEGAEALRTDLDWRVGALAVDVTAAPRHEGPTDENGDPEFDSVRAEVGGGDD